MSLSDASFSRTSSGDSNLAGDEDSGHSGSSQATRREHPARFQDDTAFGRAGSPMPRLVQEFMRVEDRFRYVSYRLVL